MIPRWTARIHHRHKRNRVLDADIAPFIYNLGLASRPYLLILALFYVLSSSMYFLLMVPNYLGYDGIAVPYTYGAAQWFYTAATYLAPIVAGILCLLVLGVVSVLVALLLDLTHSLIAGD